MDTQKKITKCKIFLDKTSKVTYNTTIREVESESSELSVPPLYGRWSPLFLGGAEGGYIKKGGLSLQEMPQFCFFYPC